MCPFGYCSKQQVGWLEHWYYCRLNHNMVPWNCWYIGHLCLVAIWSNCNENKTLVSKDCSWVEFKQIFNTYWVPRFVPASVNVWVPAWLLEFVLNLERSTTNESTNERWLKKRSWPLVESITTPRCWANTSMDTLNMLFFIIISRFVFYRFGSHIECVLVCPVSSSHYPVSWYWIEVRLSVLDGLAEKCSESKKSHVLTSSLFTVYIPFIFDIFHRWFTISWAVSHLLSLSLNNQYANTNTHSNAYIRPHTS